MNKVWLVTGSATGLGRNIAEAVLESGDRLVATARDPKRLDDLVKKYGDRVRAERWRDKSWRVHCGTARRPRQRAYQDPNQEIHRGRALTPTAKQLVARNGTAALQGLGVQ